MKKNKIIRFDLLVLILFFSFVLLIWTSTSYASPYGLLWGLYGSLYSGLPSGVSGTLTNTTGLLGGLYGGLLYGGLYGGMYGRLFGGMHPLSNLYLLSLLSQSNQSNPGEVNISELFNTSGLFGLNTIYSKLFGGSYGLGGNYPFGMMGMGMNYVYPLLILQAILGNQTTTTQPSTTASTSATASSLWYW